MSAPNEFLPRLDCFDCEMTTHCDQHDVPIDSEMTSSHAAASRYADAMASAYGWPNKYDRGGGFADGAEWGAGWAFAIVGMGDAIRERQDGRPCSRCGGCGDYLICGECFRDMVDAGEE